MRHAVGGPWTVNHPKGVIIVNPAIGKYDGTDPATTETEEAALIETGQQVYF